MYFSGHEHSGAASSTIERVVQLLAITPSLEAYLDEVALTAQRLSPTIAGCGITMYRGQEAMSVAVSNRLARSVDEAQYSLDQGPCLQALTTAEVISVANTALEERFGGYTESAVANGASSSLSVPVVVAGRAVVSLNCYSTAVGGFDEALRQDLLALAAEVEGKFDQALRAIATDGIGNQLQAALHTRRVINQAVGILMERRRCTARQAFSILRSHSHVADQKIYASAVDFITAVTGTAPRARRVVP